MPPGGYCGVLLLTREALYWLIPWDLYPHLEPSRLRHLKEFLHMEDSSTGPGSTSLHCQKRNILKLCNLVPMESSPFSNNLVPWLPHILLGHRRACGYMSGDLSKQHVSLRSDSSGGQSSHSHGTTQQSVLLSLYTPPPQGVSYIVS